MELFAKAEFANPGGSVKDRAALFMIRDGERSKTYAGDSNTGRKLRKYLGLQTQ